MNKFCPAPWINRFIHANGDVSPCCYTTSTIKNEMDISTLKASFNKGIQDSRCRHCWNQEEYSLHSPRLDYINASGDKIEYSDNINSVIDVDQITLLLGNYCNAECIICNGNTSSSRNSWEQKYQKKYNINAIHSTKHATKLLNYPTLATISLMGGEPTIHPLTHEILDQFIDAGTAKNMSISLTTNASRLDQKLIDKLKLFNIISVSLSIDGGGKYFEYQRRPLKWEIVKQVAAGWIAICDNVNINYVVTAISIWGFNDFIEWYNTIQHQISKVIFTHVEYGKEHLNLNILTDKQKTNWVDSAINHPFRDEIIKIINYSNYVPELLPIFRKAINLEDTTSLLKFADIFPNWDLNEQA